jgi:hypothetical protein
MRVVPHKEKTGKEQEVKQLTSPSLTPHFLRGLQQQVKELNC